MGDKHNDKRDEHTRNNSPSTNDSTETSNGLMSTDEGSNSRRIEKDSVDSLPIHSASNLMDRQCTKDWLEHSDTANYASNAPRYRNSSFRITRPAPPIKNKQFRAGSTYDSPTNIIQIIKNNNLKNNGTSDSEESILFGSKKLSAELSTDCKSQSKDVDDEQGTTSLNGGIMPNTKMSSDMESSEYLEAANTEPLALMRSRVLLASTTAEEAWSVRGDKSLGSTWSNSNYTVTPGDRSAQLKSIMFSGERRMSLIDIEPTPKFDVLIRSYREIPYVRDLIKSDKLPIIDGCRGIIKWCRKIAFNNTITTEHRTNAIRKCLLQCDSNMLNYMLSYPRRINCALLYHLIKWSANNISIRIRQGKSIDIVQGEKPRIRNMTNSKICDVVEV